MGRQNRRSDQSISRSTQEFHPAALTLRTDIDQQGKHIPATQRPHHGHTPLPLCVVNMQSTRISMTIHNLPVNRVTNRTGYNMDGIPMACEISRHQLPVPDMTCQKQASPALLQYFPYGIKSLNGNGQAIQEFLRGPQSQEFHHRTSEMLKNAFRNLPNFPATQTLSIKLFKMLDSSRAFAPGDGIGQISQQPAETIGTAYGNCPEAVSQDENGIRDQRSPDLFPTHGSPWSAGAPAPAFSLECGSASSRLSRSRITPSFSAPHQPARQKADADAMVSISAPDGIDTPQTRDDLSAQ